MSEKAESSGKEAANGLAVVVAIICAFAGYAQGGWVGAAVAAAVAFGGVHLLFITFGLLVRFVVLGVVLLIAFVILQNRYEFLAGLFQ